MRSVGKGDEEITAADWALLHLAYHRVHDRVRHRTSIPEVILRVRRAGTL
jgi:hypothetical protein